MKLRQALKLAIVLCACQSPASSPPAPEPQTKQIENIVMCFLDGDFHHGVIRFTSGERLRLTDMLAFDAPMNAFGRKKAFMVDTRELADCDVEGLR